MKKRPISTLLLLCATLLCVSCKVHEPVAKDATFYQWRTNQIHHEDGNYYTYDGANFFYTGESLLRDTIVCYFELETVPATGWVYEKVFTRRKVHDFFMKGNHTYVTGVMLTQLRDYKLLLNKQKNMDYLVKIF